MFALLIFTTNIFSLSVPCVPVNVQGVVECSTNTLQVSWDTAAGADSYSTTLNGAGGFSYCATAGDICVFPDLECAQTYTCGVVALNERCNSSESSIISATTGKCTFFSYKQVCVSYFGKSV